MAERERPLWADLTMDSSRTEVLAAVAEAEVREREIDALMAEVEFPEVPDGFEGCVWSKCGRVRIHYGPVAEDEDEELAAQVRAGEEDQSQPGWDGP